MSKKTIEPFVITHLCHIAATVNRCALRLDIGDVDNDTAYHLCDDLLDASLKLEKILDEYEFARK